MTPNLFQIPGSWPGRLMIVTRPRGGDWLADEVAGWQRSEIDLVVSLLEDYEAAQLGLTDEGKTAEEKGIRFLSFPIPDRNTPSSKLTAASVIETILNALESGQTVAVHCRQGIGRSGLVAAGVLTASGVAPDRAIEVVSSARGLSVPETLDQRRWILQFRSEPSTLMR